MITSRYNDILTAILNGTDVSELPPPQSREEALLMGILNGLNNGGGGGDTANLFHICSSGEYNTLTGVPTISSPSDNKIYLVPISGSSGNNLFEEWLYANNAWEKIGNITMTVPVTDVRVDGATIVNNGVANIPYGDVLNAGIIKANSNYGIEINAQNGNTTVKPATDLLIKNYATPSSADNVKRAYQPITPSTAKAATFYGLAQAAGDTSQATSENDIGAYTDNAKAAIQDMLGAVSDVQIDGTSILNNGVANVPLATGDNAGVVKIDTNYGLGMRSSPNQDVIMVRFASEAACKNGTNTAMSINPYTQHVSTFYGLAKAAGDSTQSASSNAVGAYTDAAKKAIRDMLGAQSNEWELIANYTVPEDSAQVNITTDTNGESFALSRMLVRVWLEPSLTESNDYVSSRSIATTTNNVTSNVACPTLRYQSNGAATFMEYTSEIMGVVCYNTGAVSTSPGTTAALSRLSSNRDDAFKNITGFRVSQYSASATLIPKDTIIKIYGIRI